ncbi:MAG: PQQ-binding-like beta-propeller repeat protein [Steroidobacteraceae bacterium]
MLKARILTRVCVGTALSFAVAAALAAPRAAPVDVAPVAPISAAPAFTAQQLTALPRASWITNGGNLYNQRYSPLTQINRSNVARLEAVWRTHLDGSGLGPQYSGEGQPLYYRGVIYMVTGADDVFALGVKRGKILWHYRAHLDPNRVRVCCGWLSRGLALGDGKVFLGRLDARLVALDQRTGRVVWSIQAADPAKGYSITAAPLYYDGMVIVGFAGGDIGIRGRLQAFDARTGKLVWTFHTVPGPGEVGHDTWPSGSDAWKHGGASIWQTPAVDPKLGLLYFTTGNAGPDYAGGVRAGDNLFSSSMVALDAKTGQLRWYFQMVHHDLWDYDCPNPVVLFDARYHGELRKGVAEICKTGWVYILDRVSGKPLIGIVERPVPQEPRQRTAATQPYPLGDPLFPQRVDIAPEGFTLVDHGRIFTPYWKTPVVYRPQMAANWPPSSYDPRSHHLFVCGIDRLGKSAYRPSPSKLQTPDFKKVAKRLGQLTLAGERGRGIFGAFDLTTNRIVWEQAWPDACLSGSLATGGGLVFVGRSDGRFTALDAANGKRLWQFQTDAGVNAPASAFLYRGEQYVAVLSAGNLFGADTRGDSLWLFSLSGRIPSLPPPLPGGAAGASAHVVYAPGKPDLRNGKRLYHLYCVACHGASGLGGHGGGPSLADVARHPRYIIATATLGKSRDMPSFGGALKPTALRDIAGYIGDELLKSPR